MNGRPISFVPLHKGRGVFTACVILHVSVLATIERLASPSFPPRVVL